jgi:carboxyl-terminal processing protease
VRAPRWIAAVACAAIFTTAVDAQAPRAVETFEAAWTIVRDKHFDKSLNGLDWNAVRAELQPRAAAATTAAELRAIIRDMLGRLGLSHFAILPATSDGSGGSPAGDSSGDPGFDIRWIDRQVIVSEVDAAGPAAAAGIRPGWKLTSIDTRPTTDLLRALPEGGHERIVHLEAWRLVQGRLRGAPHSTVTVAFEDGAGRPATVAITRQPETGQPVTVGSLPTMYVRVGSARWQTPGGGTAGYIRFNVWMAAVDAPFQRAVDEFRKTDGIVIDLRGNPGGLAFMMTGISGHFVADRRTLGIMKTRDNELRFSTNPRMVTAAGERVEPFGGPVAILMDALSGSASECFSGGMQSIGRAKVFGQTSMGQALPAQFTKLPNGDVLIHAFGDFVTADGTRLEGRGVIPDVAVPLTREDLLAGRDRPLEAALAWIDVSRGNSGRP